MQTPVKVVLVNNLAQTDFDIDSVRNNIHLLEGEAYYPLNNSLDKAVIRQDGVIKQSALQPIIVDVNGTPTLVGIGFKTPTLADLPLPDIDITNLAGVILGKGWSSSHSPYINVPIDDSPIPVFGMPFAVGSMTAIATMTNQTVAYVATP